MKPLAAKDVMNSRVISVPANWTMEELGQFLIDKAITGAPVIDEAGKFIGVVSLTDIVRQESMIELHFGAGDSAGGRHQDRMTIPIRKSFPHMDGEAQLKPHDYYLQGWESRLAPEDLQSIRLAAKPQVTVREIMTPMIFKVDENTAVQEIADTMIDGKVHRLLVTRDGKIVGIVTTMDLLRVIRDL